MSRCARHDQATFHGRHHECLASLRLERGTSRSRRDFRQNFDDAEPLPASLSRSNYYKIRYPSTHGGAIVVSCLRPVPTWSTACFRCVSTARLGPALENTTLIGQAYAREKACQPRDGCSPGAPSRWSPRFGTGRSTKPALRRLGRVAHRARDAGPEPGGHDRRVADA